MKQDDIRFIAPTSDGEPPTIIYNHEVAAVVSCSYTFVTSDYSHLGTNILTATILLDSERHLAYPLLNESGRTLIPYRVIQHDYATGRTWEQ